MLILCAFHTFIFYIVLFLYAAFLCFLLCMFLLYITVLLPVGVIKDDDKSEVLMKRPEFAIFEA